MENQLIPLDENMKVTIVNRKKSYEISKQKLSSIPYFVKLFSDSNCDTTKIELDLDESSFDNIIDFILDGHLSISIENALSMMETADYLGLGEIKQKYYDLYQSNFNIKLLEKFSDFYENHKCLENINEEKLNSFIRKYFIPISHTKSYLKFSIALLERLFKMNLVVSSELQMFEAIVRWCAVDETRKQYLHQLMKFINFCRMNDEEILNCVSIFASVGIDSNLRQGKKPRAYLPKFCRFDCKINRHYDKSLVAIYELGEDKINIRRLSRSNVWTKYGQFTRDETMSTSLIEADHIVDVIYDSGRKGIRVDLIGKKFKYLKMFGGYNSYYCQVYKYFAHDYTSTDSQSSFLNRKKQKNTFQLYSLEAISLDDRLTGIYQVNFVRSNVSYISDESDDGGGLDKSHDAYYYCLIFGYEELSSYEMKGPVRTRSCFLSKSDTGKVVYFLTSHEFFGQMLQDHSTYVLDYSFLKDFIGSDSLDHIELISHNNSILICNKESKMIYSFNGDIFIDSNDPDYWQFMSKIESPEKMITIASICLPIDCEP